MQPTEEWRPVADHVGYDVSNLGRVRSYRRYRTRGTTPLVSEPHFVGPSRDANGYGTVTLAEPRRRRYIHELVATAFIGPRPEGLDIAHWDGDGMNNAVTNLRYATVVENLADRLRHGTLNHGERNGGHKLTTADVIEIRASSGETHGSLAGRYGVSRAAISLVLERKRWTHV